MRLGPFLRSDFLQLLALPLHANAGERAPCGRLAGARTWIDLDGREVFVSTRPNSGTLVRLCQQGLLPENAKLLVERLRTGNIIVSTSPHQHRRVNIIASTSSHQHHRINIIASTSSHQYHRINIIAATPSHQHPRIASSHQHHRISSYQHHRIDIITSTSSHQHHRIDSYNPLCIGNCRIPTKEIMDDQKNK
jgi:hypothetical protein